MGRVRYLPAAASDLESIDVYLSQFNPVAAWKTIERIRTRARGLLAMPERGRARPDLADDVRMLPVGKHVLFYRVRGPDIEVVRVLHGARHLPPLLKP